MELSPPKNTAIIVFSRSVGVVVLWLSLHYVSSHVYTAYCTPVGVAGFVKSMFYSPTPVCHALRWTIYHGGNAATTMWTFVGTFLLQSCIPPLWNTRST